MTGAPFFPGSTQRIQRSRLRGFVSGSPGSCHPESNDFRRLDRRGGLLLRVGHLARVRDLWRRVCAGRTTRTARSGDHPREHPARHGHSSDGRTGAAQQGRCVPAVSGARFALHSAAAEAHASDIADDNVRVSDAHRTRLGWSLQAQNQLRSGLLPGHSSDGRTGAAQQGRCVPAVSGARFGLHSAAAEAHASDIADDNVRVSDAHRTRLGWSLHAQNQLRSGLLPRVSSPKARLLRSRGPPQARSIATSTNRQVK
jgi:hypothetical protein